MKREIRKFFKERRIEINKMLKNKDFLNLSRKWLAKSVHYKYNYNFTWLGRPIIKYPDDIVVMQELIWKIKPDLIIETGIAHGVRLFLLLQCLK